MARTEQREAMLRVLREHVASRIANGTVDRVDDREVQAVADALLDAGCVMADAMTLEEAADLATIIRVYQWDAARTFLRAVSKEAR